MGTKGSPRWEFWKTDLHVLLTLWISQMCWEKRTRKYPGTEYNNVLIIMDECMTNHAKCWDGTFAILSYCSLPPTLQQVSLKVPLTILDSRRFIKKELLWHLYHRTVLVYHGPEGSQFTCDFSQCSCLAVLFDTCTCMNLHHQCEVSSPTGYIVPRPGEWQHLHQTSCKPSLIDV